MKSLLIILSLLPSMSFSQGFLNSRATGLEGGGGGGTATRTLGIEGGAGGSGRSIFRLGMNTVNVLKPAELETQVIRELNTSALAGGGNAILSRFALDLANVEEITLKDGTVIKKEEIEEKLYKLVTE